MGVTGTSGDHHPDGPADQRKDYRHEIRQHLSEQQITSHFIHSVAFLFLCVGYPLHPIVNQGKLFLIV